MTSIYFVRHAEPNFNNHDDMTRELSPKGMEDRKLVTHFLADKSVDVMLSSPFKRAVDTIKDFAEIYGHKIEIIDDFRERSVGNCWIEDFNSFRKRQWEDFDFKLADGEALNEVQQRNVSALNNVLQQYSNKTIVIGSHGTALSTIINYYYPSFQFAEFEKINMLMPWIVHFMFEGKQCTRIEQYDLFEGNRNEITRI